MLTLIFIIQKCLRSDYNPKEEKSFGKKLDKNE